jgi:hypothetical protein
MTPDLLAIAETWVLDALAAPNGPAEVRRAQAVATVRTQPADGPFARLATGFVLSDTDVALLLLLASDALSPAAARALETAGGAGGTPIWLALTLVPELTLDRLSPQSPLRRFQIVVADDGAVAGRLRLAAAVRDWLLGLPCRDELCAAYASPAPVTPALAESPLVDALGAALRGRTDGLSPLVQASGHEPAALAAALAALGLKPFLMRAEDLPEEPAARDRLARAWSRDAALNGAALLLDAEDAPPARVMAFAARVAGHVVLTGLSGPAQGPRPLRVLDAAAPDRRRRWLQALGPERAARLGLGLDRVARQFRLDGPTIDALVATQATALDDAPDAAAATTLLWRAAARAEPVRRFSGMTLVEPARRWDDLVLPPAIEATLHRLESHVRHAGQVFDAWGFGVRAGGRGRGVAALFAGPSGTGKTMAAEVLAQALDLRMLVIDMSQIISKFVGETSKNIAAAFDFAERSGAVMVWNEGDAIWGARGSVGHAVDRHINAEVGDLLQRIEAFEGFTIVTTNLRHAIDPAFLRRFRFIVDFPLPSDAERLRIWEQAFPAEAPLDVVDFRVLAAQPLTGAGIHNIALASAFQAAARGGRIDRALIAAELAEELRKSNQLAPTIDWGTPQ